MAGADSPPLLWEEAVAGQVSSFAGSGQRILVGTCAGSIHSWNFCGAPFGGPACSAMDDEYRDGRKRDKKEKFRGNVKIRGRFPKTQGFSNSKGFSR